MIITKKQITSLSRLKVDQFTSECISFIEMEYPDWCHAKEKADLEKFVIRVIDFGMRHNVKAEMNVQKLMIYAIEFNTDFMNIKHLVKLLDQPEKTEEFRLEDLYLDLLSGIHRLTPITLSTQI